MITNLYDLVQKTVRVHLYDKNGTIITTVTGRVVDVSADVEVALGMYKDLALVVDIKTNSGTPYVNSAGTENESWFAVQDMEVIDESIPHIFNN